jgi:hypothetical protein
MALTLEPVKSPRYLYICNGLKRRVVTINATTGNKESSLIDALVLIKESHANWLGTTLCTLIPSDDPRRFGTRSVVRPDETSEGTDAAEQTERYVKRIGGYRADSFTLVARTNFSLSYREEDGTNKTVQKKSISIGMPTGISLNRFIDWIEDLDNTKYNEISGIISPNGRKFPISRR